MLRHLSIEHWAGFSRVLPAARAAIYSLSRDFNIKIGLNSLGTQGFSGEEKICANRNKNVLPYYSIQSSLLHTHLNKRTVSFGGLFALFAFGAVVINGAFDL